MAPPILVPLAPDDLERERPNLKVGSVVAAGVTGVAVGSFCDLELLFPSGATLALPARAVLATEAGTVFTFERYDRAALERLLDAPAVAPAAPTPGSAEAEPPPPPEEPPEPPEAEETGSIAERLRGLSVVEQIRVARDGSLEERVVVERLYGKTVWDAILRNPRVTVPEVVRLAKLGTLPRPLLELVVGNAGWLQAPQVRRALLQNPRLGAEMIQKVLTYVPKAELKLLQHAAAYPPPVRAAAKALLRR